MNQRFELDFGSEEDSTGKAYGSDATYSKPDEFYQTPGHARALVLVWPDGRRMFLSYALLIAGELKTEGDVNLIDLQFSYHNVTLRGYRLDSLFMALLDHLPRSISITEERYVDSEVQGAVVLAIEVKAVV